jgi:hypothetical protein
VITDHWRKGLPLGEPYKLTYSSALSKASELFGRKLSTAKPLARPSCN